MPSACTHCPDAAVIWQRHSGEHLCAAHVQRSVERRVTRELAKHRLGRGEVVMCAVSGGKDSVVALRLAHRWLAPAGVEVRAVTVDEGIAGYRHGGIEVAARTCAQLGVPHAVLRDAETFGITMDEASARIQGGAPCSPCGVFRRALMNRAAREAGARFLLTGHNLDDVAQSVLMNVLRGDAARLARMDHDGDPKEGLVPRLLPLRMVPEKEVALYALLQGWEVHDAECPYSARAQRRGIRDTLLGLEDQQPGTRQALVALLDKVAPVLKSSGAFDAALKPCAICGEPTSGDRCQACGMVARLAGHHAP